MQLCGRTFSDTEMAWIRDEVTTRPDLSRAGLSRGFCEHVGWRKPDGGLKEMSCRVALLRMERAGLIDLPAARRIPRPAGPVRRTPAGDPRGELSLEAGAVDLTFHSVDKKTAPFWNELIDRYHYLGYASMGGAQMRLFVYAGENLVALLGFSAAAWRVAPRDRYIGWSDETRKKRLHLVVNNSRFLILPWVKSKNLASRILSRAARELPLLWEGRYHYRPFLLETFVEKDRYPGTCYKAANWVFLGETLGRGKWDRGNAFGKPVKTIWVYPLDRRFREGLSR